MESDDRLCANEQDDDGDGFTDCEDYHCRYNPAVTVCPGARENTNATCTDRVDQDRNGHVDCADYSCSRNPWVSACGPRENSDETCSNGLDDDGNGLADCADRECTRNVLVSVCRADEAGFCLDRVDNDRDGQADCADLDCAEAAPCVRPPPPDCAEGESERQARGLNGRGTRSRACEGAAFGPWPDCADPDTCRDGEDETRPCPEGSQARRRENGRWGPFGARGVPCRRSADCALDQGCVAGMCALIAPGARCDVDAACGQGQMCVGGLCVATDCVGHISAGCPTEGRCVDARCRRVPAGSRCVTWSDCGMFQLCQDGRCVTDETPAEDCNARDCTECYIGDHVSVCANGHCIDMARETCQFDAECGPHWYCGIPTPIPGTTARCTERTFALDRLGPRDEPCRDNYALNECDRFCSLGERCGHCDADVAVRTWCQCNYVAPDSPCNARSDCGERQRCWDGRCQIWDGVTCRGDGDCSYGFACEGGQCVNLRGERCRFNSDCGHGDCCVVGGAAGNFCNDAIAERNRFRTCSTASNRMPVGKLAVNPPPRYVITLTSTRPSTPGPSWRANHRAFDGQVYPSGSSSGWSRANSSAVHSRMPDILRNPFERGDHPGGGLGA